MPQPAAAARAAAPHTRAELDGLSKGQLVEILLQHQQQQQQQPPGSDAAPAAPTGANKRPATDSAGAPGSVQPPAAKRPAKESDPKGKDTSGLSRKQRKGGNGGHKRPFQMDRFAQRHVVLKVCYFGHEYHGFASQEGREDTIEHHLFHALVQTRLVTDRALSNYSRCGRTDKGVSALGNAVGLTLRSAAAAGADRVIPDSHCSVQLNHFIPYFLSYSVPVFLKRQSDITLEAELPAVADEMDYPKILNGVLLG
jgi:hypothetical protein